MSLRGKKLFILLALGIAALDLVSKSWAFSAVAAHGVPSALHRGDKAIEILPGWLYLTEAWNPGGIWGIAQTGLGSKLLVLFRALAVPLLVVLAARTAPGERLLLTSLGLFCAGALGNLYDNLVYSGRGVRDFIDVFLPVRLPVFLPDGHWPTFNVADSAILSAAGLLVFDLLFLRKGAAAPAER